MRSRDFVADGIDKLSIFLLVQLVLSMLILSVSFYVNRPLAAFILQENGPLEIVGFASCMVSAGLFSVVARHYLRQSDRLSAAWFIAMAVALFLVAMEEISWGQKIFDWKTPDYFSNNVQDETNIHNMPFAHGLLQKLCIELVFVYFVIIPLLYRFIGVLRTFIDQIKMPLPPVAVSALIAVCFVLFHGPFSFGYYFSHGKLVNYGEVQEAFYQICFVLFSYNELVWVNQASA